MSAGVVRLQAFRFVHFFCFFPSFGSYVRLLQVTGGTYHIAMEQLKISFIFSLRFTTYYLSRDTDNVTMSYGILATISRHHLQTPLTTLTSSTATSLSPVFPRSPSNTICQYINRTMSAGQVCKVYQTEKAHNYNKQQF